jgi:hypothetical protein
MEVSGQFDVPAALHPGEDPRYPLDRRLDGLQSRSGHHGEKKNLAPAGNRTATVQPISCQYSDGTIPAIPLVVDTES